MNRRRRMLSSNLCCRFETVPGMHMQTCKHERMKKTKKAKVKILCTARFEPRTLGFRVQRYYQLSYVRS